MIINYNNFYTFLTLIKYLLSILALLNQEIEWHEKTSPGELTSRIISDTILIEDGIGSKVGTLIQNVTTFLACYVISFISSWKLTMCKY